MTRTTHQKLVLHRFVTELQIVAGDLGRLSPVELVERFEQLADAIPRPPSRAEQLVVGELLHQALRRLYCALRYDWVPVEASRLDARTFGAAIAQARAVLPASTSSRLIDFERILDTRYADMRLSAVIIAAEMNLTASHLSRLLKRQTGHGFPWHVRRVRTIEAARLLVDSGFSIKEISSRIGYAHTSQFDRHFRAAFGVTPSAYRQRRISVPLGRAQELITDRKNRQSNRLAPESDTVEYQSVLQLPPRLLNPFHN